MSAMSSRRTSSIMSVRESVREAVAPITSERAGGIGLALVALIAGLIVTAMGIRIDVPVVMGIGFTAFASSLLYLNAIFWGRMYESGRMHQSLRSFRPPYI